MIARLFYVLSYGTRFLFYKAIGSHEKAFSIFNHALGVLGGIYVKLIQFICLRTDIFAEDEKIKLLGFFDTVPVEHLDVRAILKRELGDQSLGQFATLVREPFASGTFGQVYRGRLIDGTDVVVKVLRPNLKMKLLFDFMVMHIVMFFVTLFYEQHFIDLKEMLRDFERCTYLELDYQKEAKNGNYFYEKYKNHPHVVIPKTFEHLTSKTVLVQEYIGGISITDVIRNRNAYDGDLRPMIKELSYELGLQGFTMNYFYADPHPGNIKLLGDGKFAFIDFGIVGESPKNRNTYYHIIKEMIATADNMNTRKISEQFLEWGAAGLSKKLDVLDSYFHNKDRKLKDLVLDKYATLLENYRERFRSIEVVEEENFAQIYLDIVRAGELLGVKIPKGMLATMKTVATSKSWVSYIEPEYHCMREVYKEVVNSVNKKYLINEDDLEPKTVGMEEAVEQVLEWVSRVAEKDFAWYNEVRASLGKAYA